MKTLVSLFVTAALTTMLAGCGKAESGGDAGGGDTHTHADGTTHSDDAHEAPAPAAAPATGNEHDEVSIGTATLGDYEIELSQGHGVLQAGNESHLVVKLPYTDSGATMVRAWIGTDDRTLSTVGSGTYNADRDVYDIHAMAPDPLSADALWCIEIEKPDDETMVIGSAKPRR